MSKPKRWAMMLPMSRAAWEDVTFRDSWREHSAEKLGCPEGYVLVEQILIEGDNPDGEGGMVKATVARFTYEDTDVD